MDVSSLDVLCALATLTPNQREALVDSAVLGRSYSEISVTMGCSSSNVYGLVKRARAKLVPVLA